MTTLVIESPHSPFCRALVTRTQMRVAHRKIKKSFAWSGFLVWFMPAVACSGVYLVPSNDASGLQTAISQSNAAGGTNTIAWPSSSPGGTISLGGNLPSINANTTLDATSACTSAPETIIGSYSIPISGAVTFSNGASYAWTISSNIANGSSSGTLVKTGTGTLILTGSNSYSGGTIVKAGILSISGDGALGAPSGGLALQGGTLQILASTGSARNVTLSGIGTFDSNSHDLSLSGTISGTGQLIKAGAGLLSLSGVNSYSGGTLIEGGTLGISSSTALGSGLITLRSGGALQTQASLTDNHDIYLDTGGGAFDTAGATSTFSGMISGIGGLTKTSSGTLILTGANTYSGGTTVAGGVLQVTSESNLGDSHGRLTLNGGTLQTSGALTDLRDVTIGASGGTIDTYGYNSTFYGNFDGAGALSKIGAGVLTLGGGGNTYSGGTIVAGGTMQSGVDNALPAGSAITGSLTVASGATYDFNGFSQTSSLGTVTNEGRINVASGQVTMNYGYSGTGTLALQLQQGVANITGHNINPSGTTLAVSLARGFLPFNGETFTPVSGLLAGSFASITSPAALSFLPTYSGADLSLTVQFVPFATVAVTPNQSAAGRALERERQNPTGDMATVMESLYSLDTPGLQSALDEVGPISLASMVGIARVGSELQAAAISRRASVLTGGPAPTTAPSATNRPDSFDWAEPTESSEAGMGGKSPWSFFGSGLHSKGRFKGASDNFGTQPRYDFDVAGANAGVDRRLSEDLTAGVAGAYLHSHASVSPAEAGTVEEDSGRLGAYLVADHENCRADLYGGGSVNAYSTNRGITFGDISRSAQAHPFGAEINASANGSFDIGNQATGALSPFVGLNYFRLSVAGFTERGADSLNLRVDPQSVQLLSSTLGLRYSQKRRVGAIFFDAGWRHEVLNQSFAIDARLASGAGGAFSVATANVDRDGAVLGAGVSLAVGKQTTLDFAYSGDLRPHYVANALNASLHYRF